MSLRCTGAPIFYIDFTVIRTKNYAFFVTLLGTEQEWKLAQSAMEGATIGLHSATNELCIASLKAQSASGQVLSLLTFCM